ncbi:hypothetical protein PVAG01_00957 [Phlyctema vagabunda]|uniref:Ribosomal protein S3 n=1 Tax=Phlyctema vagabunda TaxID=108571 RepID=A0ABR4PW74_9HELO
MFLSRMAVRKGFFSLRPSHISRPSTINWVSKTFRYNSTNVLPKQPVKKKPIYPDRLLIYHAGTGRTVFIGGMKLTTIGICVFFVSVVAPTHFYAEQEPTWISMAVITSGIIPMLFVLYTTAPFVTYVHLRLPAFAKRSQDLLIRYARSLPKDAELDITTVSTFGKARVSRAKIQDLFPIKERFGLANYGRDTTRLNASRPWYLGKAVRQFGIHGGKGRIKQGGIWEIVQKKIDQSPGPSRSKYRR